MKFQSLLPIAALCAITIFSFCKNDGTAAKDATTETGSAPAAEGGPFNAVTDPSASPTPAEPAQNAAGLWHYTCPKGCAGGAGAAEACAKCGTTLTHNTTYHGTPSTVATPPTTTPNPSVTTNPSGVPDKAPPITMPNTAKPEPAQNGAGVWHYTCPSGCAGGGGSAAPCAKCSKPLVHNKAYHQ